MKIALVHPASPNPAKSALIWPPLGLCRIAGYLEDDGHEVMIVEDALDHLSLDDIIEAVAHCDMVGVGAMTLQAQRATEIARAVREVARESLLVAGGPHFSALAEPRDPFDVVVVGDGEIVMSFLARGGQPAPVMRGGPLGHYQPISFRWIDYACYGDHLIDRRRAISILTSRGCPHECKFCGSPRLFGRRVVHYPVDAVAENMRELTKEHGIRCFRVMDDTFTASPRRVSEFCRAVAGEGYAMSCLTHIRNVPRVDWSEVRQAGFEFVALGIESADDGILAMANKHQTRAEMRAAVALLHDANIKVEALFMIGLPGETKETLRATIDFASELACHRTHAQFFTPFPGCAFRDEILAGRHGKMLTDDFARMNHREPMFLPEGIHLSDLMSGAKEFFTYCHREIGK